MKRSSMLKVLGLVLIAVILVALWTITWPRSPQDLRMTSVNLIHSNEVPRTDEPSEPSEPQSPLAVVQFRSNSNLADLAENWLYEGLYAHFSLCRSGERISEGTNLVFDETGRISFGETKPRSQTNLEYHVYLALRSNGVPGFGKYDLLKNPEDVCLVLVPESPNFGEGTGTNVMRLTQKQLTAVLAAKNVLRR